MFPALRNVTPERIKEKLNSGCTSAQVAVWLTSSTISRELNNKIPTSLDSFVGDLQDVMILKPGEKSNLMVHIRNNEGTTAVDALCDILLHKSDEDINQFISILDQTAPLSPLGQFLHQGLVRCEEISQSRRAGVGGISSDKIEGTSRILSMEIEVPEEVEKTIIEKITNECMEFIRRVFRLPIQVKRVGLKCILLEIQVMDLWDLHNVQCDILFGMFSRRLVSWLSRDGIQIDKESIAVTITVISEEKPNLQGKAVSMEEYHNEGIDKRESVTTTDSTEDKDVQILMLHMKLEESEKKCKVLCDSIMKKDSELSKERKISKMACNLMIILAVPVAIMLLMAVRFIINIEMGSIFNIEMGSIASNAVCGIDSQYDPSIGMDLLLPLH